MSPDSVLLLSGGLDSATTLYWALYHGFRPACLTVDYGQLHKKEIECAKTLCRIWKLPHKVIRIPLPWKGSALLNRKIALPKNRSFKSIGRGIPSTYVPARNTIMLSFALSWAEVIGARNLFIGAHALDYSGYPDCRPEFFRAMERVCRMGTKRGVEGESFTIQAPLLKKTKSQIIRLGARLKVPFAFTWSCYSGGIHPCGKCDSCRLRAKGFREVRLSDPA